MNTLEGFLSQNRVKRENERFVASESFLDSEGKPLEWELRVLSSTEDIAIRRGCYREIRGAKGQIRRELDGDAYVAKLAAASVVFPDLLNAGLQDSYGVKSDHELLMAMLDPGELALLEGKVQKLCGFDTGMNDLVDEAKN